MCILSSDFVARVFTQNPGAAKKFPKSIEYPVTVLKTILYNDRKNLKIIPSFLYPRLATTVERVDSALSINFFKS